MMATCWNTVINTLYHCRLVCKKVNPSRTVINTPPTNAIGHDLKAASVLLTQTSPAICWQLPGLLNSGYFFLRSTFLDLFVEPSTLVYGGHADGKRRANLPYLGLGGSSSALVFEVISRRKDRGFGVVDGSLEVSIFPVSASVSSGVSSSIGVIPLKMDMLAPM